MENLATSLWFDHQAEEATEFYLSLFKDSKKLGVARYGEAGAKLSGQKVGSVMVVEFEIGGHTIQALNGGPIFKFSPSFSYTVACKDENEIDSLWKQLSAGGQIRMDLQKYPWAEKYGWCADRFGVEWQLSISVAHQKIVPSMLFTDSLFGKGEEAIKFYTSVFPNSKIETLVRDDKTGTVMYSLFTLNGNPITLMEGAGKHGHTFTHATSLVALCESQKEIDLYWEKLSAGGSTEQCGWLKDKFGVSWQIVPATMSDYMSDPVKSEKVMAAMGPMKKLDMQKLMAAAGAS